MVEGDVRAASSTRPVRVVAFDDHPVCARGLRLTIEEVGDGLEFVGVLPSVGALDDTVQADVALLELCLHDGSRGRDNVAALVDRGMTVLVYTNSADTHQFTEALGAGAAGVVCKFHPEQVLVEGIRRVRRGETFLPDDVSRLLRDGASRRPRLSAREVEVLNLLYLGLVTKQAARRLQVSESTVKEHLKRIRQKYTALGRSVSTRVQLLQVAQKDGFITPDESVAQQ
jgi:DNA-binding NarL/FixJ family response regulator